MEGHGQMTIGAEQLSKEKGDTWPKVLRYNGERYGSDHRAMRYKHYGIWEPCTWKDYYQNVKTLALGLMALGFEPGDRLLIIGDNAPQWYYAELAAQAIHGASVGVYSDFDPEEIKTIARHSGARFAVVEDQEQIDKFLQVKEGLPLLQRVIYWNYKGLAHYDDPVLMGLREVQQLGEKYEAEHPAIFERNVESGQADEVCAIVYTSGTTGTAPKAAVHTFRTMRAGSEAYLHLDPWTEKDNLVPYLPPVWMNEQWLGIGCHLLSGCCLNFAEGPETLQRDIRETGPSIVCYGARLWEAQAAMIQSRILEVDTLKKQAFSFFMPLGYKIADQKFQKKKTGFLVRVLYSWADTALFKPVRKSLGLTNARICYSTGAILSPEVLRFYQALNLPLKSLYCTTEGGPLTGAGTDDIQPDTVGPPLRGTEIKVSDQGELLSKQSGMFIGYYGDPGKTKEVLKDGWFYSGDYGFIREDGHIVLVDRMKDLIERAGSEKIAPQLIESRLKFSPYIKDAWVLPGPDKAYLSAVIVINYGTVSRWAGQRKIAFNTFAELSQRPEVYTLVRQDIDRVNGLLSPGSRIKKYVHLHKEFDPDEGELTRNRNLKRPVLEARYQGLIEAIYADTIEASIETPAKHRDGRTQTIKTTLSIKSTEGTVL